MDIKNLIKVNIINIILLLLVCGLYLFFDNVLEMSSGFTIGVTAVLAVFWAVYAIYSNYTLLVSDKDDDVNSKNYTKKLLNKLKTTGNVKTFAQERATLCRVYESVVSRKSYVEGKGTYTKLYDLYELTESQIIRNIENATEYVSTYDYISGRDTGYMRRLANESTVLLDKFNKLMELSVSYDDTSRDYDTRELDDMIENLEKMKDIGKGKLGA